MENNQAHWHSMSDPAILQELGTFIRHNRLQQNRTQHEVAESAGVNRSTLVQIEKGKGGTMLSLIQLLRALQLLDHLHPFKVVHQLSPLQLAKLEHTKRQRAGRKQSTVINKPESDW
jgi:transcriptional regulator with XRE-family HTH domain